MPEAAPSSVESSPPGQPNLERFSERFPPHGALAAEGAENLLGRPRLDPLVVLVREAVQNSWDARSSDDAVVGFEVRGHRLDPSEAQVLRSSVFPSPPGAAERLQQVLGSDELVLLALTDRGTTGLRGPVRADRTPGDDGASNFVDLLFNIGQPSTRELGGGTYGFGKTISYVVSEARAIVVHSRTEVGGRLQSRFMASAFTDHYSEGELRFTGRHWWGRMADDAIEPVVGDEADRLAASLGLPDFGAAETGTTICVVAPDLRGRTVEQAMNFLAHAISWNFWPKMVPHQQSGEPAMRFSVSLDGNDVPVADPADVPLLRAYAGALQAVRARHVDAASIGDEDHDLELHEVCLPGGGARIGLLALARIPVVPREEIDEGVDEEADRGSAAPFEGLAHHVALLREPELVVQYAPGEVLDSVVTEWVGVFKPVRTLDRAFAAAEPPTHDGWQANLVRDDRHRRVVSVARRSIQELTGAFVAGADQGGGAHRSAIIADVLRGLIDGGGRARQQRAPLPAVELGEIALATGDGGRLSDVHFIVQHEPGTSGSTVEAAAIVASHDGSVAERHPPPWVQHERGGPVEVVGFVRSKRRDRPVEVEGSRLVVRRGDANRWLVRVRSVPELTVAVDLTVAPLDPPSGSAANDRSGQHG